MSPKVIFIFCIIVAVQTSIYGEQTQLTGPWTRDIERCASGGGAIWILDKKIRNGTADSPPFDSVHVDSVFKVEGQFEIWLGTKSLSISKSELSLRYFNTRDDAMIFRVDIGEESHGLIVTQIAKLAIILHISRNGDYRLENLVRAYTDMALSCASAKSIISTITLIN